MPDHLLGISTVRELQVLVAGAPYLSASVTYSLTDPTGTVILNSVPAPHGGDGWYQVLLDGNTQLSVAGTYSERWQGLAGSADLDRSGIFTVLPPQGPQLTRLELRHQIAAELGDLVTGTLTAAAALSLTDPERIESTNYWAGGWFSITSGPARDQERRLTASDPTGLLAVGRAWNVIPGAGDYYEGHRKWRVRDYNRALDRAMLDAVESGALVTVTSELVVGVASQYEYPVPAGFALLAKAEAQQSGTSPTVWQPLRYGSDWQVRAGRLLWLAGPRAGVRVRLTGQMYPELLRRDGAYVDVRPGYLLNRAAVHLLSERMGSAVTDPDQTAATVDRYAAQAQAHLPTARVLPNSRVVA